MTKSQHRYYMERAHTSLRMAKAATDPAVAKVHMNFYESYMRAARKIADKFGIAATSLA